MTPIQSSPVLRLTCTHRTKREVVVVMSDPGIAPSRASTQLQLQQGARPSRSAAATLSAAVRRAQGSEVPVRKVRRVRAQRPLAVWSFRRGPTCMPDCRPRRSCAAAGPRPERRLSAKPTKALFSLCHGRACACVSPQVLQVNRVFVDIVPGLVVILTSRRPRTPTGLTASKSSRWRKTWQPRRRLPSTPLRQHHSRRPGAVGNILP